MKSVMLATLFMAVCLGGILAGVYNYIGSTGTHACRADSIARCNFLSDPAFSYERQYFTVSDLEGLPDDIVEQYRESAREGYVLAVQGNWDKLVMLCQSLLLFVAGAAGLIALRRPKVYMLQKVSSAQRRFGLPQSL